MEVAEVRVEVAEVPRSSRKEGRRPYSTLLSWARPGQAENEARAQPALTFEHAFFSTEHFHGEGDDSYPAGAPPLGSNPN